MTLAHVENVIARAFQIATLTQEERDAITFALRLAREAKLLHEQVTFLQAKSTEQIEAQRALHARYVRVMNAHAALRNQLYVLASSE